MALTHPTTLWMSTSGTRPYPSNQHRPTPRGRPSSDFIVDQPALQLQPHFAGPLLPHETLKPQISLVRVKLSSARRSWKAGSLAQTCLTSWLPPGTDGAPPGRGARHPLPSELSAAAEASHLITGFEDHQDHQDPALMPGLLIHHKHAQFFSVHTREASIAAGLLAE